MGCTDGESIHEVQAERARRLASHDPLVGELIREAEIIGQATRIAEKRGNIGLANRLGSFRGWLMQEAQAQLLKARRRRV